MLPLADRLSTPDDCLTFANKFEDAAIGFESIIYLYPEELHELIRNGESLKVIGEILRLIHLAIQPVEMTWCKVCFRRAISNLDYCKIHYSSSESLQDTANKKGNRVFQLMDGQLKIEWERHRLQRRFGGENVILLPDNSSPRATYPTDACLMVPEHLLTSFNETICRPWSEVSSAWDAAIDLCPEIRKRFDASAESFPSWNDFVASLFESLQEPIETTRHPLWVLYILRDAEAWFVAESKYSDRRKKGTPQRIVDLIKEGRSIPEIALELGITKKYISQILREFK